MEAPALAHRRIRSLVALDRVLAEATARIEPVAAERLPVADAVGAVLAEPMIAGGPIPPWTVAARDGWAVSADTVNGASPSSPVFFSEQPAAVESGERMPAGTDAVLPFDTVAEVAGLIEVTASVARGDGRRERGYDADEGLPIAPAGRRLGALALAAARAAEIQTVPVRRPRVRVIATGTAEPPSGATTRLLIDLVGPGAVVTAIPCPDEPATIAAAVARLDADLVITIGGTGEGATDRTVEGVAGAGEIIAHGIAIAPGETTAVGFVGTTPVLMLPGRPDAALAGFLFVGRPILARLSGGGAPAAVAALPLAGKIVSTIGMAEIHFVAVEAGRLVPLGGGGLPLGRLARADGFVTVPPASEGWPAGTVVPFEPLGASA